MLKKYLKTLIPTSLVTLLPILAGLLLWDRLPDTMNIHWSMNGTADGTASKAVAIIVPSLVFLALHWLCSLDTICRNHKQSRKVQNIALWLCPMISLLVSGTVYSLALGFEFDMSKILFLLLGILFAVMGNYMPKFRQNPTLGIKTSWALADEENWNATHRFGGRVWMAAGFAVVILSFIPKTSLIIMGVMLVCCFAPVVYSWNFYQKKKASGADVKAFSHPLGKWSWLVIVAVLILLFFVLFTGKIEYAFSDDALTVASNRMGGITVSYEEIDNLELREEQIPGTRTMGYGSMRLLLGAFQNEEFGNYTRYTYYNANPCIVITAGSRILVLSDEDAAATRGLYQQLLEKVG